MASGDRKSGIEIMGDIAWGTHLCQFYQTKDDLIDILVPYFKAGLENNEFCMWVTSEPLGVKEAKASLGKAVRDLDDYIARGQLKIVDYSQWYTKSGNFDADEVLQGWVKEENQALERGFDGLRLTGNTFWLDPRDWKSFCDYEATVNSVIGSHQMIAICTYSLDKCGAPEILDVISNHEFALIRRAGLWTMIENAEQKRIGKSLKDSEVRYRRLFETAQDGILILDAETGQINDTNPFLTDMLGYSKQEIVGRKLWEIGTFRDETTSREAFLKLQNEGYVRYDDLPLQSKTGKTVDVEFVSNVYTVDSTRVIQCNIRDITERRQAQEALERLNQQLQAKVSELEAFSYGIAHDLRSPLISIEGFSRELREDMLNHDAERVQEDIRLLESGVRKMQDFLNSTLEYSRSGQMIKRTRNVSFGKIAKEVITEFNGQISSIGATVSLADKFPRVYADRNRIIQVLANLIQNSIKYRGKTVPLKIEIGHYPSGNETVFFMRDNGTGIDASEVEKLFNLFYRGTADGEGSGIGLAIVKKIIEAHGGRIWIESQSGKGTTMCFTLPKQSGTNKGDYNGKD